MVLKTSRRVVLAGAAALALTVAGCGGNATGSSSASGAEDKYLQSIRDAGVLRVGVAVAPPMTIQEADGTMSGPNLIPLRHLAEKLNVKFETVPTTWGNIVAGLIAGKYDFAANLDQTAEREKAIAFSAPVYLPHGVFVVKASSAENSSEEIFASSLPIATSQGSSHEAKIVEKGGKTLSIDTYPNAVQAVKAGRAVAEFTDLPTAEAQVQADASLKIVVPDPLIYQATANYGLRKNADKASLEKVNNEIAAAKDELKQALIKVNYFDIDNLGTMEKGK